MTTSTDNLRPRAMEVHVNDVTLTVELEDGRSISVPIVWYPRLANATPAERANHRLIAGGEGIHWPDIDEDLSVEGILAGRRSGENLASLSRWLKSRTGESQSH